MNKDIGKKIEELTSDFLNSIEELSKFDEFDIGNKIVVLRKISSVSLSLAVEIEDLIDKTIEDMNKQLVACFYNSTR